MKKLLLIPCLLFTVQILAQENTEPSFELPRTLIKISPFQFMFQTLELSIEAFNKTYSKSFNASIGFRSGSDVYNDGSGGSLELGYRKYVSPMSYHKDKRESYWGVYYSLFVRGEYFKGENVYYSYYGSGSEPFTEKILSIAPGFTIGLQRTLWKVITLDAYVGGGVKFSEVEYQDAPPADYEPYYDIVDPGYSGIYPKIGLKIGIGF